MERGAVLRRSQEIADVHAPALGSRPTVLVAHARSDERAGGLFLLVALNLLNLVDAALTAVVIRAGVAIEGNPVVSSMGLTGKLIVVPLASLLLWGLRPKALVVPLVVYALVVSYSLGGLVLHG